MQGLLVLACGQKQRGFELIRFGASRGGLPPASGELQRILKIAKPGDSLRCPPENIGFWCQFGGFLPSGNGQLRLPLYSGELSHQQIVELLPGHAV